MRKRKSLILLLLAVCLLLSGCDIAWFSSTINELKGSLIGNSYTIGTYDNYGNKTLETSGKKISITGNKIETISYDSNGKAIRGYDLSSVITITIDGKRDRELRRHLHLYAEWPESGGGFFYGGH